MPKQSGQMRSSSRGSIHIHRWMMAISWRTRILQRQSRRLQPAAARKMMRHLVGTSLARKRMIQVPSERGALPSWLGRALSRSGQPSMERPVT